MAGQADIEKGTAVACPVVVHPAGDAFAPRAEQLAARLGVVVCAEPAPDALLLRVDEKGISLVGSGMELRGDLTRMLPRIRQGALQRELLVRAARTKGATAPWAIDATAGLGEDSLLLAAAGFRVTLYERDPVIAALLADALERAANEPQLKGVVSRMTLVEGDSVAALWGLSDALDAGAAAAQPDVVLLDPMFPERHKSASVKKKMQLLQRLEGPCGDEDELVRAALAAHPRKVVIKRPAKGPYLAGVKPSYSIAGKAVRYDCLVPPPRLA